MCTFEKGLPVRNISRFFLILWNVKSIYPSFISFVKCSIKNQHQFLYLNYKFLLKTMFIDREIMPKEVIDRETSRRVELQVSFLRPLTQRCPGRARRHLTDIIYKSIIITPVFSWELNLARFFKASALSTVYCVYISNRF